MKAKRPLSFCFRSLLPAAISLCFGGAAHAGNTWDGGGTSANWSDADNWDPIGAPSYGTLTFSGSTQTTNTVDSSVSQNILLWTGSSNWTLNNSGGAIISLYDNGGGQAKIENLSTGLVTINAPVDFAATAGTNRGEINAINGNLTFDSSGTINVSGSAVSELHFYGSGNTVTINSVLTAGTRKLVIGPTVTDNNTVILNAANSYSGNTEVNVGSVQVGNDSAIGTGSVFLGNGGPSFANLNSSLLLNAAGLSVTNSITTNKADTGTGLGSGTRTIGGNFTSGTSTFSGAINLNGGAVLTAGNGGTVSFTGAIQNGLDTGNVSRDLSVTGSGGTIILSGANTYTGKTTIEGGATLSINADSRLGTAPGSAVADQLTLNSGTLRITAAGQTLNANRGITLGASGGTIDSSTITGAGATTTIGGLIAGSGPLTLRSTGNMSATGGSDTGLGIKLNQATNTFTGDVTITSGLVSYSHNLSFGNSSNKIILNGGGLLDNNVSISLARDIQVLSGGGTFRGYGSTNATWSGAITGSGSINRTDGGTITHSGDLSGFSGTYNIQGGTTSLTGTAATIGGNWTIASGTTLNINSSAAQSLAGTVNGTGSFNVSSTSALALNGAVDMGVGSFNITGNGKATINGPLSATMISMVGTTSELNIGSGATVTTKYINIGNSSSNSGRVYQTGGTVTVAAGDNGFRIGHWTNNSNPGSIYNLSGGVLDATAISQINIGWDGQGDMIVGGGAGSATLKTTKIQLDANGDGGGAGAGNMTLTLSSNGLAEIGSGGIAAAASGDQVILNGGTLKATTDSIWGSVITANTSTTSVIDTNGSNITLPSNIAGSGTINLSSASGSILFNTSGAQTVSATLAGVTPITKSGTGTTTLSGTGSTHSGLITVNDGRLNLSGTGASAITVASGKTLGGEGTTTGAVSLTSGFINIDPNTGAKLTVGDLNLAGTTNIRFDSTPAVAGGPVDVLTYTGALSGTIGTHMVLENGSKYRNSTFVNTGGAITLDIQSKALTWNGTSGGQWDTLTSSRWNTGEADSFAWGDSVTFDDSGVATSITMTGELQPSSITVSGAKNYTISGGAGAFISGLTGISKSGSSTLLLNAANTFTGATSITEGTVQVGDGSNNTATLGTGSASISSGANLVFYRNGAFTANNSISGTGTLAFQGTGVSGQSDYSLAGNNSSFTGTLDIRNGSRVSLDSATDVGSTASIVVNNGGQLWVGSTTLPNNVSVTGNGWTEGAGQLGAIRFTGGTLGGTITLNGNTRLTTYNSGDTGTVTGVITDGSSSFGITKTGSGTLTLTNTNTYDGGTVLSTGAINIRNASSLGTGGIVIGDGGTGTANTSLYLDTNRTSFARQVTVSSFGSGTVTLGSRSNVTGSGDNNQFTNIVLQRDVIFDSNAADRTDYENVSGVGNITFTGVGRSLLITSNSFTGNVTINAGIGGHLQIGTATAGNQNYIPDTASLTVNDTTSNTVAEFRMSVGSETIAGLNGNGTIDTNSINATLTVGAGNVGGTFSGIIQNGGANTVSLTKIGSGIQILSGANTTTGTFTVNGGLLRLNNANSVSGGLAATGGTAAVNINGGVLGLGAANLLRGLGTGATQVQITGGASGFSAHGATRTVNFGGAAAGITWGSATFNPSTLVLSHSSADGNLIIANPIDLGTSARTIQVDNGSAAVDGQLSGALSNSGTLTKTGLGTLSISGTNTASGAFTLSSGGLVLDYTTNNTTKLADGASLTFGTGTTSLDLAGGSHTEVVASTTLSANAYANITRSSGTSVIQLGTITVGSGAMLNLGASGIASTNNTNTNGILGPWATVGNDWAVNSTNGANGLITAFTGYSDVTRLSSGTKAIADSTTSNVRITEGTGTLANITLGATTTNINSLNQIATGGTTTVAIGSGNTLRLGTSGGVLSGSGTSRLDITGGTLTAGGNTTNTAGSITFSGNTANTVSVSSVVGNNGTGVVSLVKSGTGTLILNGANTFSGGLTINAGTVAISAMGNAGSAGGNVAGFGTGTVTINNSGTAWLHGSTSSFGTIANAFTLAGGTLHIEDGATTFSGNMAVNAASTIQERWGDTITFTGVLSGAGGLTFQRSASGSGENPLFIISGNNTITGAITAGANSTVRLGHANALGTTAAGTTVVSGGVLDLNGQTIGAEAITLNGTGIASGGALINSNTGTAASLSGGITLASSASIGGAGNTTFSGVISGAGFSLTKVGAGTVTLSGNNTYNGTTTVSGGRLNISGTNASQISLANGTTLGGIGSSSGTLTTAAGSTIALNGTTPTSGLVFSGSVNFNGSTALTFDAVPSGVGTISHRVVTYGGIVSGVSNLTGPAGYRSTIVNDTANSRVLLNITTGTRTWNQTAPGTWALQTGTNFAEGDQQFASGDAAVFDDTATNGAVTISGTVLPGSVTINNSTTDYTFSGSGAIGGSNGITKNGTGTLTITNANTYTGTTTINNGTLNIRNANALGTTASGTTISSGGTLEIQGGITTAEPVTATGTGFGGNGAIRNVSGTNTMSGAITLTNNASVLVSAGELVLSAAAGHTGGPFTLTKNGSGSLRMTAANNNINLTINNGTLFARGGGFSAAFAPNRTITVDGTGILDTTTHSMGSEVGGGGAVPIIVLTNGGTWQANNEQYIRSLTMTAGNVTGAGELRTLSSSVYTTNASSTSTTVSAGINLVNGLTFTVNDGAAANDAVVTGYISNASAWSKAGAGTLVLSGTAANTFTNTLSINAGVVRIEKNSGLGTTAAGTTVASGAALQLANNITVGAEALGLSGTGVSNDGALRNVSGTNSFAGDITLNASTRINSDAGSLALSGAIIGGSNNLTVGGAATTSITGAIGGTGTLTKDGAGTLGLNASNTYTGATSVTQGRLNVNGSITSDTSVSAGASLGGDGAINGAVSLSGTLLPGQGGSSDRTLTINGNVTTSAGSVISFDVTSMANHDQLIMGSGSSIGLNNADLVVNFDNALTFDLLTAGEGDDFLAAVTGGGSYSGTGSWFRLISGDTTGMFSNVTETMSPTELAYFGLSGTQYKVNLDGQAFWVAEGSTYLVAIPEPRAALIGSIGMLMLLRRRRR